MKPPRRLLMFVILPVVVGNLGAQMASFVARRDFPVGSNPSYVAAGDFDADGKQDLAVANSIGKRIAWRAPPPVITDSRLLVE